jgi:hypothetical protein
MNNTSNQDIADVIISVIDACMPWWLFRLPQEKPEGIFWWNRVARGAPVTVIEIDPDTEETVSSFLLTLPIMRGGIHMAAEAQGKSVRAFIDNHDAFDADLALQMALLGEERYA